MKSRKSAMLALVLATASLPMAVSNVFAQPTQPGRAPVTEAEIRYQAGGSPLAQEDMHQNINPKAPAMTKAEYDKGRQIYFERCAGCHGTNLQGTGKARSLFNAQFLANRNDNANTRSSINTSRDTFRFNAARTSRRASATCRRVPYNAPDPFQTPICSRFRNTAIRSSPNGVSPPVSSHGYCPSPPSTL